MTSATGSGSHRRRDRVLGIVGQVAGVTGIVICIVLIVGALLGRGWAMGTVDTIATRLDAGIGRAIPPISTASGLVGEVADRVGSVAEKAEEAAANPGPEAQVLQDLQARLQGAADRYLELRTAYSEVRTQAVSIIDRLETIDRMLPGVSIPTGPIDKLTEVDARIQEMDAAIIDLIGDGGPGASDRLASEIAEKARAAEAKVTGLSDRLDAISTDLLTLQADLDAIEGRARTAITLADHRRDPRAPLLRAPPPHPVPGQPPPVGHEPRPGRRSTRRRPRRARLPTPSRRPPRPARTAPAPAAPQPGRPRRRPPTAPAPADPAKTPRSPSRRPTRPDPGRRANRCRAPGIAAGP